MNKEQVEEYKQHQAMLKELRGEIRDKLKECKDEWLEKNAKGQKALGVLTVQQILDNATGGLWSFIIEEQWREEVSKFDKKSGSYYFDGYVYHVRGRLEIEGLGARTQYGSKVAVGGKDNQNSSYKAAASDCLKKAASLFGVGASIYAKIRVEEDEYTQIQQDPAYAVGQQQQQAQPQTYVNQQGYHQNGEYVYFNNNWVHQNEFFAMLQQQQAQTTNGGQYPSPGLTEEQQRNQWYHDTMKQNDPQGYQQMVQEQQQQSLTPEQQLHQQRSAEITQTIAEVDQEIAAGKTEVPFNGQPVQQQTEVATQEFEAQPQHEALAQGSAQQQNYQAVEYGAPASPETAAPKKEEDPLKDVQANNPWNTPENQVNINQFAAHKTRLGITRDADLLPYIRDYFKDEKAGLGSITPDVLSGFNEHLQNIAV
jgi:hypothetical protein